MTELGNYVHLHLENYYRYGTYTTREEGKSNFRSNIFNKHFNALKSNIKTLKISNIKTLEQQYNNAMQQKYKLLKDLATKTNRTQDETDLLKSMLSLVSKSVADNANTIVKYLVPTENGLFKYNGPSNQIKTSILGKFKYLTNRGKDQKFYIQNLIKAINNELLPLAKALPDKNAKQHTITLLNTIRAYLGAELEADEKIDTSLKEVANLQSLKGHGRYAGKDNDPLAPYLAILTDIINQLATVENINRLLEYRIPEILGELTANMANDIGLTELKQLLTDFVNKEKNMSGASRTKRTTLTFEPYKRFEQNTKEKIIDVTFSNDINGKGKTQGQIFFNSIGSAVQQKADVVFEGIGLSIKTTSFTDFNNLTEGVLQDIPHISLQNSSILLYIMGIEQQYPNLGNHYLNILAEHDDKEVKSNLRASALRSLKLHILYSALTGRGQLREAFNEFGGIAEAKILAVFDKQNKGGIPKIKMFSMYDILNSLVKSNLEGALFSPTLESIKLNNKKIILSEDKTKAGIRTRISNLLIEARAQHIAAAISKTFLKQVPGR